MPDARTDVFLNYRRDDSGWAANALAAALRRLLHHDRVFQDTSSIPLGRAFAQVIDDAVGRSAVLVALIGPSWDRPPLLDRLTEDGDWVRRELLLARELSIPIVPILVDRQELPDPTALPEELRFLSGLQRDWLRQTHPEDTEALAERVAALSGPREHPERARDGSGNGHDRRAIEELLRRILPRAQQRGGNRDRLVDLALAVLAAEDHLVHLAPARLAGRPAGSATVLVTRTRFVVVDVDENFRIRGEIGVPLARIRRVHVAPRFPLYADLLIQTSAGDNVELMWMFRGQARQTADHLRAGSRP